MATYVSNKLRAFKAPGDPCDLPLNSQSLFHMKTYNSATDSRAWACAAQDRKQYIFELFAAQSSCPVDMYMGKYVNVHALMHTLLGNKDADIYYLQSQLKVLEAFLEDIHLTDQQRKTLECLKQQPLTQMWSKPVPDGDLSLDVVQTYGENSNANREQQQVIYDLNQKVQEQETELERQRELAQDASVKISVLNQVKAERDDLKFENGRLQKSLDALNNTKASSNNDLLLKQQISELRLHMRRKEARKLNNLKIARSDQVAILPEVKSTHEVSAVTSQTYIDITKIIEERNVLQETVRKLLQQMDNLHQLDSLIEKHLPDRNDRMAGDHASQVSQTLPYLQAENELKREIEILKSQLGEFQIKNLEFDRLCLRISELQLIQKEHEEMKVKYNIQFMEQMTSISQYVRQIDYLKDKGACLQSELDRFKKCEDENNILSDRCKNLQGIIESQQGKVRYLENCKSIVVESESRINELRQELDKKSSIIKISEDKLLTLQSQLRESINSLTCETTILKNSLQEAQSRITGLLEDENLSQSKIRQLQEEVNAKDVLLRAFEQENMRSNKLPKILQERDNIIQHLRMKLLELQRDNDKLGTMTSRLHCYIMSTSCSSNSIDNNAAQPGVNGKCIDNIYLAMRQLQTDLAQAKSSCEVSNFYRLQARYKDLQASAKSQVHWLATELRNCKQEVQFLQCHMQEK